MKLDIEAIAREADSGFGNHDGLLSDSLCGMEAIEAFARLIVERCAQEAEDLQDTGNHIGECPASAWEQGTLDAAEAIRNLLED